MNTASKPVTKRRVFYVPGYDPMPPRKYRELYRAEGKKQAEISGYSLNIEGGKKRDEKYHWTVHTSIDGHETASRIDMLLWNDIVSKSMNKTIPQTYWLLLRTLWLYLSSGAMLALFKVRWAPMLAALYPAVILFGQVTFAFFMGILLAKTLGGIIGGILGIALFAVFLVLFRRLDRRFFAYYLLHDFSFWAQSKGKVPAVLQNRIEEFADRISAALDSDADEVLIIGHSSGAHLAVVLVAKVLRERSQAHKLSLLTLGQSVPVVSFLPEASDIRRDLRQVSMRPDLMWLDVSAPGDGACFALSDPVAVTGIAPPDGMQFGPKVISAAYTHTMSEEWLKRTRFRFFSRHIQYLKAFDMPLEYDYFRITSGPYSLRHVYGERGSSASCKRTPRSPHTSMQSDG